MRKQWPVMSGYVVSPSALRVTGNTSVVSVTALHILALQATSMIVCVRVLSEALRDTAWQELLDALDAVTPLIEDARVGTAFLDMHGADGDFAAWSRKHPGRCSCRCTSGCASAQGRIGFARLLLPGAVTAR